MNNYYKILGLTSSASVAEIKTAFRALAKIYHPDKNPGGQEDFKRILLAYETLSDPNKKYAYDLRLKYQEAAYTTSKTQPKKNWTFEEKEMRRRQYYNEHIKKYEKKTKPREQQVEIKSGYNEFKYILFATPLAVLLFLLVIHFASGNKSKKDSGKSDYVSPATPLKPGDSPYASYFGGHVYDTLSNLSLVLKNNTGKEIIACLFTPDKFVRGCYIKNAYSVEIGKIPDSVNEIRYYSGYNWDSGLEIKDVNILGGFRKDAEFYMAKFEKTDRPASITLTPSADGFEKISAKEFFSKNKHHD